ncbi:hypothetical protein [Gordonia soli]|uniref:TetR family transcriptional regulator n=1 Tax=Gordonia soli NBRC 108243 TaxID=1223545 RepID=M0QFR3_9ACTN|nr:hypothetical protein [Gordonia soli]GAC67299.1 hypothetical protein GS4_07_00480 [Gordonia soli NBRC 108243]
MTFAAVAKSLDVTQAALYKHVSGVDELRQMIAEAIFVGWDIPGCTPDAPPLPDYLLAFGRSIRELAHRHPGITPYLTRRDDTTPTMVAKIAGHHVEVASAYDLPPDTAAWLLSTIAFHCVALGDTIYASYGQSVLPQSARDAAPPADDVESEFIWGLRALVLGALQVCGVDAVVDGSWRR